MRSDRSIAMGIIVLICVFILTTAFSKANSYPWLEKYEQSQSIIDRIPVPDGYERIDAKSGNFGDWLRNLPLKKGRSPVYLYNGQKKVNQNAHFAVVDIDVGDQNLQQCADAVIRLRAEYFYSNASRDENNRKNYSAIHFNFTSGDRADFTKWIDGYRPIVNGNKVRWVRSGKESASYHNFRKYLDTVFMYAGSYSLSKELHEVRDLSEMKIGDVFIEGGFPGHAVIVLDLAVNKKIGKKLFLLAQSYMPAQEIHILKNLTNSELDPWYELDFRKMLYTPEWTFSKEDLKRFNTP